MSLAEIAQPVLNDLEKKFRESCFVAVLDGTEVLYISRVSGTHRVTSTSRSGVARQPLPYRRGAAAGVPLGDPAPAIPEAGPSQEADPEHRQFQDEAQEADPRCGPAGLVAGRSGAGHRPSLAVRTDSQSRRGYGRSPQYLLPHLANIYCTDALSAPQRADGRIAQDHCRATGLRSASRRRRKNAYAGDSTEYASGCPSAFAA